MNIPNPSRIILFTVVLFLISASVSPPLLVGASPEATNEEALNAQSGGSFSPTIVRGTRGNKINISVSTDSDATLNLGSRDIGFLAQVNISGSTEVTLDTYQTNLSKLVSGGGDTNVVTHDSELNKPLVAGTYNMNITVDGREVALGKFIIEPRGTPEFTGDIERWASPAAELGDTQQPSSLPNALSITPENETPIPKGRWAAFRVNTSEFSEGFLRMPGNVSEKFAVSFVEQNPELNTRPNTFTARDSNFSFVNAPSEDSLYFFVNTGNHGIEADSTYRVNVSVIGDNPFVKYPESVETNFSVVEPQANLQYSGTPMDVNTTDTIRGTTTLLPGEDVNITARYDGFPPFFKEETATVKQNQTFEMDFDFSSLERGDTFTITLPDQDKTYEAVRAWEVRLNYTGEKIQLSKDATITGDSKLDPGTEFKVEANYEGEYSSFSQSKTVVVTQTGDFSVDFDLKEASPDGNLSIRVPAYNKTVPAILVPTTTTTTTAPATTQQPATTTTPDTTTTTATQTETQTTESNATSETTGEVTEETTQEALTQQRVTQQAEQSSQPIPGFTSLSTLFAIFAALLLISRRR